MIKIGQSAGRKKDLLHPQRLSLLRVGFKRIRSKVLLWKQDEDIVWTLYESIRVILAKSRNKLLVIVHPMTSFSGSVAYLKYVALSNKGDVKVGDEFNSVFGLGDMTESRMNYTAQLIVENVKAGEKLGLTPAVCGKFEVAGVKYDAKVVLADGTVQYKQAADISTAFAADAKVYYFSTEFQMEKVPATDIPTIGPKMERIALVAEPRRIAVKYDQITAYQAKTDYGFSLDKQIAEQACGELAY